MMGEKGEARLNAAKPASDAANNLASHEDWSSAWSELDTHHVRFDPNIPIYRDMHRTLRRVLATDPGKRFLEIGAFPGQLLWYFSTQFGYRVSGLEYLSWGCQRMRELLRREGVAAEIIEADLFSFDPPADRVLWDVVCSHGFIEHFSDPVPAIHRHFDLVRPGGLVILIVPNHANIYGRIMRAIRPDKYAMHNRMTLKDTLDAVSSAGPAELLFAGYLGRLGFWSCCLYETVLQYGRFAYTLVRAPLWVIEHVAQRIVPNSAALSPSFMVIARKPVGATAPVGSARASTGAQAT